MIILSYHIILYYHIIMSMLSVPLTPKLEETIDRLVKDGVAPNKAELARKAIEYFAEQQAIEDVLRAEKEPTLRGDFKELLKKFK